MMNSTLNRGSSQLKRTPFKARKKPLGKGGSKIRKGTLYKAINPTTGRVVSVKGAKGRAWKAFAAYIRARDPFCITCGDHTTEAGHYHHTTDKENKVLGGNEVWYDERNVNGQCGRCNRHKSGNGSVYGIKLVQKYGPEVLPELWEKFNKGKKWTMEELFEIEEIYKKKLKEIL